MIQQLQNLGNWAGNSTSDAATQNAVLTQQRDRARGHRPDFVISNHFNGHGNASARGVEVLYRNAAMLPLARAVSAAIARELGIPNRGAVRRTNLFFLNSFPSNGILIEWAFMTNAADMRAWGERRTSAVNAAARTIAENTNGLLLRPSVVAPPAAAAFRLMRILQKGSRGADVVQLQQRLNALGMRDSNNRALATDGIFGPLTRSAVQRFQRNRNIGVTGAVGSVTAGALGWTWGG